MAYLIDTCLLSEPTQQTPNLGAIRFLRDAAPTALFISSISLAEAWKGIELLPLSKKRAQLEGWFQNELLIRFDRRILSFDLVVAQRWGTMAATLMRSGRPVPILDSLLAATALAHDLTLVTRNEKDFAHAGVRLFNPWKH